MFARLMIAGAAALALTTGTGQAAETPATATGVTEAKVTPKQTEKELTDHEGNKLLLGLDDAGNIVKATAKDKSDKPLDVVKIKMKDTKVCVPKAKGTKPLCQPLEYVSENAFFKMGTTSCTCQVISGYLYCYGTTCH
jgi:hypothetical protein